MSKRIIEDLKVIDCITEALTETKNSYFKGNCEWRDGGRSDIVLEPKSFFSELPLIILEIQHTVDNKFMRKAVNYCLQANLRYDVEPILLIICVGTLHEEIKDNVTGSRLQGIYSYFCKPWAAECLIMCPDSLNQNLTSPLDPLVALGLFLSNRCLSILDNPYANDTTIQYLYALTLYYNQIDSQNITNLPMGFINNQIAEYDRLITLANILKQPELEEAISKAKARICTTTRKYADLVTVESSSDTVTLDNDAENGDIFGVETSEASASDTVAMVEQTTNKDYEVAMNFVAKFKQERAEQGKKMNWIACMKEGKDTLKYKNTNSLRSQFYKYTKRKERN